MYMLKTVKYEINKCEQFHNVKKPFHYHILGTQISEIIRGTKKIIIKVGIPRCLKYCFVMIASMKHLKIGER